MKKLIYFLFCVSLVFTGCTQDQDDVFDLTSAKRAEQLNKDCKDALLASPNGWVMEYFPDTRYYGGVFIYMSFDKDSVWMTDESDLTKKPVSLYSLKLDNGPVLSFDTYNEVLHKYSDPGSNGVGYGGDYEFIISSVNPGEIVMTGKKGFDKIFMHALPEGKTFSQYLDEVKQMDGYLSTNPQWKLIDGKDTLYISGNAQRHFVTSVDPTFVNDYVYNAAMPSSNGITFNPALELNGKSYASFKLSEDGNSFVPVNKDLTGNIVGYSPVEYFGSVIVAGKMWSLVNSQDAMSAKVKNAYDVMANSCKAAGKTLASLSFCIDPLTSKSAMKALVEQKFLKTNGYFFFDITDNNTSVTFNYKGEFDPNAKVFMDTYNGFGEFATLVNSEYDIFSNISPFDLSQLKLVSKSDSDLWFVVQEKDLK